eukprot:scaffold7878_cov126-Isochrysis_galbana.AAC.12
MEARIMRPTATARATRTTERDLKSWRRAQGHRGAVQLLPGRPAAAEPQRPTSRSEPLQRSRSRDQLIASSWRSRVPTIQPSCARIMRSSILAAPHLECLVRRARAQGGGVCRVVQPVVDAAEHWSGCWRARADIEKSAAEVRSFPMPLLD